MADLSERKIVVEESSEIPWLSVVLGFGPMLPIVAAAIVVWTTSSAVLRDGAILLSAVYAGAILAFLAGVRRGLSFRTEGGPAFAQIATMASMWLAAFLALVCVVHALALLAFTILAPSYAALMILDPIAARSRQAPLFFARLRPPQLLIAVVALVALLANVWVFS